MAPDYTGPWGCRSLPGGSPGHKADSPGQPASSAATSPSQRAPRDSAVPVLRLPSPARPPPTLVPTSMSRWAGVPSVLVTPCCDLFHICTPARWGFLGPESQLAHVHTFILVMLAIHGANVHPVCSWAGTGLTWDAVETPVALSPGGAYVSAQPGLECSSPWWVPGAGGSQEPALRHI